MLENNIGLSEEMRQHIFRSAHIDWWTADLKTQTMQVGEYVSEMLGIPQQTLPISVAQNYIETSKRQQVIHNLMQAISKNAECVSIPLNPVMFDNQSLIVLIIIRHNDTVSGYVRVVKDEVDQSEVSTLKERDLSAALKKESDANKMKSAFLANMSHELRTPLNAIVGFSKIIADTESDSERREYLKIILDNNEMLLRLIDDILDLSKIEAGMLEFNLNDFELDVLISETTDGARMRLSNPAVALKTDFPDVHNLMIHSDRNRVAQVMNNFINNAIKFTPEGSITVHYEIRKEDIYFSVTDTGRGIPANQLNNVFNRFVRLDKRVKGTGLGLAISSTIIAKLGGRIGVESQEGKGSTFWFTLPIRTLDDFEKADAAIADVKATATQPEDEKTVVLIAEDDASNYKLCEVLLGRKYKLLHAWDGKEAVEMFKHNKPSIVLMDINMPVMNGYEASEAIRKLSWDVPIVAVTAYALADDEQRIMNSGFDGYLPKPLESKLLDSTIHDCIDKEQKNKN